MLSFGDLGSLPDRWPRDDDGNFVRPAFLLHCDCNDLKDEIIVNMLEAYGIPCIKQYPGDGSFGHVVLGMSGNGTDIYVPENLAADAAELCKEESDNELEG